MNIKLADNVIPMTTDLFEKFDSIIAEYSQLPTGPLNPFTVSMDTVVSPTEAIINGKKNNSCWN